MAFQIGNKYYHEDIESGEICEISKTTYDAMMKWRKLVEAKVNPDMKVKGTTQIIGTMQDNTDNNFKDIWENNNWNLKQ